LRRAFKRIDKNGDGDIDCDELTTELITLGHSVRPSEAALTIWEVDDDADGKVNWEEFKGMFYRIRDDQTGYEPRKLFNVVEFIMHDKNSNGTIDLDEAVTLLHLRFGKGPVDEAMSEIKSEEGANEKSMTFSVFVKIQATATKIKRSEGGKAKTSPFSATTVPQVKGLEGIDPSLAHLT